MIPRPRKMRFTEGTAAKDVPVKEEICAGLGTNPPPLVIRYVPVEMIQLKLCRHPYHLL